MWHAFVEFLTKPYCSLCSTNHEPQFTLDDFKKSSDRIKNNPEYANTIFNTIEKNISIYYSVKSECSLASSVMKENPNLLYEDILFVILQNENYNIRRQTSGNCACTHARESISKCNVLEKYKRMVKFATMFNACSECGVTNVSLVSVCNACYTRPLWRRVLRW